MKRLIVSLIALGAVSGTFGLAEPSGVLGDLLIEGPSVLAPGSRAALRVVVFESRRIGDFSPAAGAEVVVTFNREQVHRGTTDDHGGADVAFTVPRLKDGNYDLKVDVKMSSGGLITHTQSIRVHKAIKILMVTDKPLYQPGQVIHLRALALADLTLQAAAELPIVFEVEDAKGNKVFKQKQTTSKFGVASADFQLADEVNMGAFRISATMDAFKAEKTVTVKKYVLPKFKAVLKADKKFYLPKQTIDGDLQVDYMFGKPVAHADVVIVASTFDVAFKEFARLTLKTDAQGHADFEIVLPDYFVGTPLNQGNASVRIEAKVTDAADHSEVAFKSLPVSEQPMRIYVIAESGKIVPDVENTLFVITADPNGGSIQSTVSIKAAGRTIEKETNTLGYAEFRITPKGEHLAQRGTPVLPVTISAKTKDGTKAEKTLEISTEPLGDSILLRLDKSIYAAGDRMTMDVLGSFKSGDVFIDVVKKGQTLLTSTVEMKDGRARYQTTAPAEAFGSLEIHAYTITKYGEIIRDTRVVYVQPANDLAVKISTDQKQYRPGEMAEIRFQVTDAKGRGVAAAMGVIIVDESVYALQEMQPGLEKVYFMLEKELATPKVEFCPQGATVTGLVGMREVKAVQQDVGKMLFAGAEPVARRWTKNTLAERRRALTAQLNRLYWPMYNFIRQHGKEITYVDEKSSKRRFSRDAFDTLKRKARKFNIKPADLKDPWGRELSLETLQDLDPRFRIESWYAQFTSGIYWTLLQALSQHSVQKRIVTYNKERKRWRYVPNLVKKLGDAKRIAPSQMTDVFGDEISVASMARAYSVFSAKNLAQLTREQRLQDLFVRLQAHGVDHDLFVVEGGRVTGYADGAPGARDEFGEPFDLVVLAKKEPAFAPANLAKLVDAQREQRVFNRVQDVLRGDGVDALAAFDLNTTSWKFRTGVVAKWVKDGSLPAAVARRVSGKPFTLEALAGSNPAFGLGNQIKLVMWNKMWKIYNALNQFGRKNRAKYANRRGEYTFPGGVVNLLVIDKLISRDDLKDPWGGSIRVRKLKKKLAQRIWWNMPWNVVEAAGPDRTFDTADDISAPQTQNHMGFGPNYQNAVWFQQRVAHGWFGLEGNGIRPGDGMLGGGRFNRGRRDLLREELKAGAPEADAAPMKMAKARTAGAEKELRGGSGGGGAPPPRVREFFPETLLWQPNLITDENGAAKISLQMADTITTWRLTASASSANGLLGSAQLENGIRVFQDFFVDLDLPVSLTQNDTISIPVAVYNYLKRKQTISLKFESGDWFDLEGEAVRNIAADPGEVQVVYFPIRVRKIGTHRLTVVATGSQMSDAIRREIEVTPDGQRVEEVLNGSLKKNLSFDLTIPEQAVPDASKILVKFYPGVFSQLMDGLGGMLRMPGG